MSTAQKTIVKFLKPWRGYNVGEIAGFDPDAAEKLTNAEIAEEHDAGQSGRRRPAATKPGTKTPGADGGTGGGGPAGGSAPAGGQATGGGPASGAGDDDARP